MDDENEGRPGCGHSARELLSFYLNGSLADDERVEVETHLRTCALCAGEVEEYSGIAGAIEAHGAGSRLTGTTGVWRRTMGALGLAAALVVATSLTLYWTRARWLGTEVQEAGGAGEVRLDLGAGPLRDESRPPTVLLIPSTRSLLVTFFPPSRPGVRYRVGVADGQGRMVVPEEPLGRLDEIGRAVLRVPASAVERAGSYQVFLKADSPGGEVITHAYTFGVRRSGGDPGGRP